MKSMHSLSLGSVSKILGRGLFFIAMFAGSLATIPVWSQSYTVQPSIDKTCTTKEVRIVVPAGQVALGFTFDSLDAGLSCKTKTLIYDKAWGISTDESRSGNVYYYNHNGNGTIYSLTNNQKTPLPLNRLRLSPGIYYVHVDGGIYASVKVYYSLVPVPAVMPAGFPLGIVWRFGRTDGTVLAARITLLPGGRIQGYSHPNEDHWGLENGKVVFYNASNQAITRFSSNVQTGGVTVLSGAFLPNPAITHVLTEVQGGGGGGSQPPSDEKPALLWKLGNDGGIDGGNGTPPTFYQDRAYYITELYTYHWNDGQGQPIAGTVTLRADDGTTYGPWQAEVINKVYWRVTPKQVIPAGNYTLIDSDPKTWAQNSTSNGTGMGWAHGIPAK